MIRSTFSSIMTARSGIMASQLALDVVGNNMSNVNTNGYTRRRLDVTSFTTVGASVGQGVRANSVSQLRSSYLDSRFRAEYCDLGGADTTYSILSQLEGVLDDFSMKAISDQLSELMAALNDLSNYGGDEYDALVRSQSKLLCDMLNGYTSEIASLRGEIETDLDTTEVPRVNEILAQIAELNKDLRIAQACGEPQLDMLDQRNVLLDELSGYMDIKVTYSTSAGNPNVQDVKIEIAGNGGSRYTLMENSVYGTLSTGKAADGTKTLTLTNADGTTEDLTDGLSSGVLKAALDMLNKSGEFDGSDVKGIGYYEKLLDVLAKELAGAMNEANKVPNPAYDPPLVTEEYLERPLFESGDGTAINAGNIRIAEDWANGEYGVTLTHSTGDDNGQAVDNLKALIDTLKGKTTFTTPGGTALFTGTFQELFGFITTTLQAETAAAKTLAANKASVVNGVVDLRDSMSAVSLDEEAINMMMYQKSFNAASRLMTALDEALDQLINRTGVVGR